MGTHVISLRSAWRLGGALLSVTALTSFATALLLWVHITLAIAVLTVATSVMGLACLRIPWDRLDVRWLFAVPAIAVV
jgi:hypothetical protein